MQGPPCTEKQQKILDQLDRDREGRFAFERKLLLKAGVPFDPDILMEPLGQYKLKPVLEQMPEMKRSIRTDFLSGLIMADTLYVSGAVALGPGPTVVLVNHVVSDECIHLTTTPFGTDEFYSWSLESGRVLGMSLKQALEKNGLTMDLFPGSDHLPSFSVIQALNLPKVTCSNPTFDSRNPDTSLWKSAIQH
jgi:hypothetical protein